MVALASYFKDLTFVPDVLDESTPRQVFETAHPQGNRSLALIWDQRLSAGLNFLAAHVNDVHDPTVACGGFQKDRLRLGRKLCRFGLHLWHLDHAFDSLSPINCACFDWQSPNDFTQCLELSCGLLP